MNDIVSPVPPAPQLVEPQADLQNASSAPAIRAEPRVRLWPALIFVVLQWAALMLPRYFVPGSEWHFYGMMGGPTVGLLGVLAWWLFASRVPWRDCLVGLAIFVAVGVAAYPLLDESWDFMGVYFAILPAVITACVLVLLLKPFLSWRVLRVGMLAATVLTWGYFMLLRFDRLSGVFVAHYEYRWIPTNQDKLLASEAAKKLAAGKAIEGTFHTPLVLAPGDWPGFRGAKRDGQLTGVKIATDWNTNKPKLLWHHLVGAGWSSFAVVGKHLFTQEQLQEDELVVCYDANTGEVIWVHRDKTKFNEKVGGEGPRATPTFHDGKLYVLGATGKLNCLDAATGQQVWARDIVADSGVEKPPIWGFASSPLVVKDIVTVFAGGPKGKSVLAYKAATGEPAWQAGEGIHSYCSMQPATLCGVEQLVVATEQGLISFLPTGEVLWKHDYTFGDLQRVVQPTILNDTDVLLGTGFSKGTKRVRITKDGNTWTPQEVWTTKAINPYFNDLVVQNGHIYGFEGDFFICVDLETGKQKWKERGYGTGQVLLLADQNLLLVLSDEGEVALNEATPTEHKEIGRFLALPQQGRTWNHPVVANGKLFVRNGAEAACYQLTEIGAGK